MMDILVELTSTDMIFNLVCCTGAPASLPAGWATPMTYDLDTYKAEPETGPLGITHLVVRKLDEPVDSWPPVAAFPLHKIIYKTTAAIPFQTANEAPPVLP